VPVSEPDPERLDELAGPAGREIAAEAGVELAAARRRNGVDRAHALEAFVSRYPRHPAADNALVEGARDYAEAGRVEASCDLARRVPQDYPAGDAVSAAQELVARCERSRP
jgi:thioredoxin-like negative regulator of GroEL